MVAANNMNERVITASAGQPKEPIKTLRICLAASGGGHVRQLLDLKGAWSRYSHFFLTEDSALSRSVSRDHKTYFVSHVALGQARLGSPMRMLWFAFRNFFESVRIILRERPHVVVTTGAGAVFCALLWARLLGAKIILIESFARFDRPSVFARIAAPFAHYKIVQSKALTSQIAGAMLFDPLRVLDTPRPPKKSLMFVTVGATLPFNRMVETVAQLKAAGQIPEAVIIQTGVGGCFPTGIETYETLTFDRMQSYLRDAEIVVCHGGTGSLVTALREGCRVIVMPRQFERGEHYDNHQSEITRAFVARNLIAVANSAEEMNVALKSVRAREALSATTDARELVTYLEILFSQFASSSSRVGIS